MGVDIKTILDNTKEIFLTDSALTTLLDFERVLDELDLYAFANWKKGELVEGPVYEKYFVTCTFMWPYRLMPDPQGGARLLEYDCVVRYKKEVLEVPKKVEGEKDFKPGTKMPKMKRLPVWLVEIVMPKMLMQEIERGSVELEQETVDAEDIDQAYEQGIGDDEQQQDQGDLQGGTGGEAEAGLAPEEMPNAPPAQ